MSEERSTKKSYGKPTLTEYGSIAKFTQGSGGTMGDGAAGMTRL